MSKSNGEDLESIVKAQKEQLIRYETRLKDVVIAYKGLLKEKAALEASFKALALGNDSKASPNKTSQAENSSKSEQQEAEIADQDNLHCQISTLMNNIATLSGEKSRMEANFQSDKKLLRQENMTKDKLIKELNDKLKEANLQASIDVENLKSKFIVERHRRDKEYNDQMVMVRELQKLLADERHLKENLEMQLNDLKMQFSGTNYSDRAIKQLNSEVDMARKKLKYYENSATNDRENSVLVQQLRNEISNLKQQHAAALKSEQKRTFLAEEKNKKLAAVHEERVVNLESRLSELSQTIGTYDRLRQQDQELLFKLKDKLAQIKLDESHQAAVPEKKPTEIASKEAQLQNVNAIIDEIINLKNILSIENAKLEHPIDIKIFYNANSNSASETDETISMEEYEQLKNNHMQLEIENTALKMTMETQKSHIKTLKEKVKILNSNIEEHEVELKNRLIDHNAELKAEKNKWKGMVSAMELDFRSKISHLEQNLQKQRDRSLLLLEEKENEIKTIKTSFEIFIPGSNGNLLKGEDDGVDGTSENPKTHQHLGNILNVNSGASTSNTESSFHMLHYAHELARKDVEISSLRKAKHAADTFLRQALQDKVTAQTQLHDRISHLEDEVENYKRYKSREGANMEYLKNVVLSFLTTMDQEGKKKMLNAISAVLCFSPSEMSSLNASLQRK